MAIHSSILARRIPWAEEPGTLQLMGSQIRTQLSDFHFHKELISRIDQKENLLQFSQNNLIKKQAKSLNRYLSREDTPVPGHRKDAPHRQSLGKRVSRPHRTPWNTWCLQPSRPNLRPLRCSSSVHGLFVLYTLKSETQLRPQGALRLGEVGKKRCPKSQL